MSTGKRDPRPQGIPELSRGAVTLLAIAQENDKQKKIATNATLAISLEFLARLSALCAAQDRDGIRELLGRREVPGKWFEFCVALVDAIDSHVDRTGSGAQGGFSLRTDFDRSVFLALGQTIAEATGENRQRGLALEVSTDQVIAAVSKMLPARLQQLLIKHYVGNILQELFDACRVRLTTRGLPRDIELNLRGRDADVIAETLFAAWSKNREPVDIGQLLQKFQNQLAGIWQQDAVSE
jgi:hypothetical protein